MIATTETKLPKLITALPGPNAKRVVESDAKFMSPSYTRDYPLVAKRGHGAIVEDVDGNAFLDFAAGIAVCSTGHCHPKVVAAIQQQAAELIHMSGTDFYYESMPRSPRSCWARCPAPRRRKLSSPIPARKPSKAPSSWRVMPPSATKSSRSTAAFTDAPWARFRSPLRKPRSARDFGALLSGV